MSIEKIEELVSEFGMSAEASEDRKEVTEAIKALGELRDMVESVRRRVQARARRMY